LSSIASLKADSELDIEAFNKLLNRVKTNIHSSQNRVRYTMNGFVIAVGSYVEALTDKATEVAQAIGKINVDVGGTSCKVPLADVYIKKVVDKNRVGKKRKTARC
jgi:glycerol kinase